MQQSARFHLTYLAIALFGVMLLHDLWSTYRDVAVLPYSTFEHLVDEGKIHKIVGYYDRLTLLTQLGFVVTPPAR